MSAWAMRIITSAWAATSRRALQIGQVLEVNKQDFDMYQEVTIRPTVNFDKLEFVLVITNFQPGELESVG